MTRRRKDVQHLAHEAHLDEDEALIALWDAGISDVVEKTDRLKDVNRARRTLGLGTRRELRSIAYWMSILDLYEPEFHDLLRKLSVPLDEESQMLSAKAVSRLKSEARKRGIDPITGMMTEPATRTRVADQIGRSVQATGLRIVKLGLKKRSR